MIIGQKKAISALENQESARILLISDSHGNSTIVKTIVEKYGSDCDALFFCGDGLCDIAELLTESKNDKELRKSIPEVIACVGGNCDPKIFPMKKNKHLEASLEESLTVCGHKVLLVHGHAHGVDYGLERLGLIMKAGGYDAAFYGHTHIASFQTAGNYRFINPGSCSRPRGSQNAGFAIATFRKDFIDVAFIRSDTYEIWMPIM
ncbi:MAG: metallophosphoesterase [Treponema sp.]|nr:metallophosphoesterase [Treponema sp.]